MTTMATTLPLYLGGGMSAVALAGFTVEWVQHRRRGLRMRNVPPELGPDEQWAARVSAALPRAFEVQPVTKAGAQLQGVRPTPTIRGSRPSAAGGRTWVLDLPNAAQADDYEADRIAAALNAGRKLVAAAELRTTGAGWAELSLYRRDPLDGKKLWPHAPGEVPPCCRPGTVCMGLRRDGEHLHFDMVSADLGTIMSLVTGRRGSGKSEAIRLMLAQMLAWGPWVRPVVVDLVRRGVDFAVFEPVLQELVTDQARASAVLDGLEQLAADRAAWMQGRVRILGPGSFTPGMPLHPLVIDEVQAIEGDDRKTLRRLVQQTRPQGVMPVLATQYPTEDNIDVTTRLQAGNVWCGALGSAGATGVVFPGMSFAGRKPHQLGGRGECVVDVDRGELDEGKAWLMSDGFLEQHVRVLARQRERVRVG